MARRRESKEAKKRRLKEVRVRKLFLSICAKPDDKIQISEAVYVLRKLTGQEPFIFKRYRKRSSSKVSVTNDTITVQCLLKGSKAASIFDKSLSAQQYVLKKSNFLPEGYMVYHINNHTDLCETSGQIFRLDFKVVLAYPGCLNLHGKNSSPGVVGFLHNVNRNDAISWFRVKFNGVIHPFT